MTTLHIRLLGDFVIEYEGESLTTLGRARLQSLLAYLLLHSHTPQSRQRIAFALWPDSSERQAHNNLRKALHQLRQAFPNPDHLLAINEQTLQWRAQILWSLDVIEFESKLSQANDFPSGNPAALQQILQEAVALYGGDLLPSCYDSWIIPLRERLRQMFLETLERLLWLAEDQRDYASAIHHAHHLLQHDPLHEATYRRLMRLYMADGNRASALRTYHTCATLLQRELGVEPGTEIRQAYAQLLEMEVPTVLRKQQEARGSHVLRLAGRQAEWKRLRSAWQQVQRGHPHFCLISGEAGIGKTRLAEELLAWAERQAIATARTRSYGAGQSLAYAPLIEWLQSTALQTPIRTLDDIRITEIARLLPDLLRERPHLSYAAPATVVEASQWQRQRLFEALAKPFLDNREPKLLLIDDLQWCDSETLAWLRYLFRAVQSSGDQRTAPARLLIVGTMRPEEVISEHPLTHLLLDLRSAEQISEIALAPLNQEESAELATQVAERGLDAATLQRVYAHTEGNPLFIVETVRVGLKSLPEQSHSILQSLLPGKVLAVIQARLAQLSASAHQLACTAAVIGRSFSFELLREVSGEAEGVLVNHLDELWRRGIVRTQGGQTYDFSHDRIRDVAYGEVSPVRVPLLNRQIAKALEQIHQDDLDSVAGQIAAHYDSASAVEEAIGYYQRAADVANAQFAYGDMLHFLERAMTLVENLPATTDNKARQLVLSLQRVFATDMVEGWHSLEHSRLAVTLAQEVGSKRQQFDALDLLRAYYQVHSQYSEAAMIAEQMLALAAENCRENSTPDDEDAWRLVFAHHLLGNAHFHRGNLLSAQEHYAQGLALQKPTVGLLAYSAYSAWLLGYPVRARRYTYKALVVAQISRVPEDVTFAAYGAARLNYFLGQMKQMRMWADRSLILCETYQTPFFVPTAGIMQARGLAAEGKVEQSIAQIHDSFTRLAEVNHFNTRTLFWGIFAEIYATDHRFSEALASLDEASRLLQQKGERFWHAELMRLRGEYLLALERPSNEAETCYQQAIAIAQQQSAKSLELRATMSLCRLWQQQGKLGEARTLLAEIYNWFSEGHTTADLQAARALLAELS